MASLFEEAARETLNGEGSAARVTSATDDSTASGSDGRTRTYDCDPNSDHTEKARPDGTKRVAVESPKISLPGASLADISKSRESKKARPAIWRSPWRRETTKIQSIT